MPNIIIILYDFAGEDLHHAALKAQKIVRNMGSNVDRKIGEEAFCQGCLQDDDLHKVLNEGVNKLY